MTSNFDRASRFALVGGFLGAGKTTAIGAVVRVLQARGLKCGLITNDQGKGLVDSVLARERAVAVAEILGGCFCCRLDDLVAAVERLSEEERPNELLAEPVGSCTDLMATVLLPLARVYRMPLRLAPLSVLLDGRRAYATLVSRGRARGFSKDVGYIYRKQIEEAEMVVINKIDLLTAAQRGEAARADRARVSGTRGLRDVGHLGGRHRRVAGGDPQRGERAAGDRGDGLPAVWSRGSAARVVECDGGDREGRLA